MTNETYLTKRHLDFRLMQHTIAIVVLFVTVAGLFKIFS